MHSHSRQSCVTPCDASHSHSLLSRPHCAIIVEMRALTPVAPDGDAVRLPGAREVAAPCIVLALGMQHGRIHITARVGSRPDWSAARCVVAMACAGAVRPLLISILVPIAPFPCAVPVPLAVAVAPLATVVLSFVAIVAPAVARTVALVAPLVTRGAITPAHRSTGSATIVTALRCPLQLAGRRWRRAAARVR
eukprot:scaffold1038_cov122-Isochrysis_galbana.AAC.3